MLTESQAAEVADKEAIKLIFEPGFSAAVNVSDISVRGVGMDAVKAALQDLKGSIAIKTVTNKGTSFVLSIPA